MFDKDEWTQKEFLEYKKQLQKDGQHVYLVDTILKPIKGAEKFTIHFNPFEMREYEKGSVFVFYCDSGKNSLDRLDFFRSKLPDHHCVSLRGGRGYWRPSINI